MNPGFYTFDGGKGISDTSETIQISSLALIKMMRHGRAGIPLEVMGLMLGEFVDDYHVKVIDVFAMPQSGTGVTVEAVDPVFQAKMMDILKETGRSETVVGWYHSHPGFGCWLSSVDVSTQSSFEQICKRAVAVVVDPIQSVKGNVVIDAFRNSPQMGAGDPRTVTSCIGYYKKPSFIALVHGLNKSYYSFHITYPKDPSETRMLGNLNRKSWIDTLIHEESKIHELKVNDYLKDVEKREEEMSNEDGKAGVADYRKHLKEACDKIIEEEALNNLLLSIHHYIFQ